MDQQAIDQGMDKKMDQETMGHRMDQETMEHIKDQETDQKMDQEMAASTSADEEDVRIIGQMSAELHRSGIDIGIYDIIELDVESFE